MKKVLIILGLVCLVVASSGCVEIKTPCDGPRWGEPSNEELINWANTDGNCADFQKDYSVYTAYLCGRKLNCICRCHEQNYTFYNYDYKAGGAFGGESIEICSCVDENNKTTQQIY